MSGSSHSFTSDGDTGFTVNYNCIDHECQYTLICKSEWNADDTANDLQAEWTIAGVGAVCPGSGDFSTRPFTERRKFLIIGA